MKLLFLDFDGVLNSDKYFTSYKFINEAGGTDIAGLMLVVHHLHLDPDAISLVNELIDKSGAQVVVSSTWRLHYSIDELNKMLASRGATFKIIAATPRGVPKKFSQIVARGDEIQEYLDSLTEKPESFVIIDDQNNMVHLRNRLVLTTFQAGFNRNNLNQALKLLNGE